MCRKYHSSSTPISGFFRFCTNCETPYCGVCAAVHQENTYPLRCRYCGKPWETTAKIPRKITIRG